MKTIIVTGASRGLGLAIAAKLAADGYRIVGMSRTMSEAYRDLMERRGHDVAFQSLDLAEAESIAEAAREAIRRSGPIYGLVNNAGVEVSGVLATMAEADIERLLAVDLLGPIILTRTIMGSMLARGEGRIVNISSIVARTGFHGLSVYAAAKAGLEGFTRSLSREAGKRNITVNCVAPGYMETEMTAGLPAGALESARRRAPLGLPRPDQVAAAVSYLMTPDACTVTGTVLTVDGGGSA